MRFAPRELPEDTAAEYVQAAFGKLRARVTAEVVMRLPLQQMQEHFGPYGDWATDDGDGWTRWPIGGADFHEMFMALVWVPEGVEYRIEGNSEFAVFAREVATRITAA